MSNFISIVGRVATDPKLIRTQTGIDLCAFRVASGERRYDREQGKWVDGETNWYGVTAFRTLAQHSLQSFRKGERVIVSGRLRLRRWENGERTGLSADIEADAIGHDVRWGVSHFEKSSGEAGHTQNAPTDGAASGESGIAQGHWHSSSQDDSHDRPLGESESSTDGDTVTAAGEALGEDGFVPAIA